MPVNAINARSIALDLVMQSGVQTAVGVGTTVAIIYAASPERFIVQRVFTGYQLPHRNELGRPWVPQNFALPLGVEAIEIITQWATFDLADAWKKVRTVAARMQNDNQAAALTVIAARFGPDVVTKYLRPYLNDYINDLLPAVPHDGQMPLLAKVMQQHGWNYFSGAPGGNGHFVFANVAMLLFFGRGIQAVEDIDGAIFAASWA